MKRLSITGWGTSLFVLGACQVLLAGLVSGCRTAPEVRVAGIDSTGTVRRSSENAINSQPDLALASQRGPATAVGGYRVGPGDVLEIAVFQAEELNRSVRVRPDGLISLPLLGPLEVVGSTTSEVEGRLCKLLGERYLQDPQVSVFVREYRAHPVSVLGAVNDPGVYYLREPRTLVELLSEAGGLSDDAGATVLLRRQQLGSEADSPESELVSIDLKALVGDRSHALDRTLRRNDTIYVPEAGIVFVEGAVKKPGSYPLQGAGTVLKAVTLAGGLDLAARESGVHVVRARGAEPQVIDVDLSAIRNDPSIDIAIQDGDVVMVGSNPVKVGLVGLWRGIAGLVNVSKGF